MRPERRPRAAGLHVAGAARRAAHGLRRRLADALVLLRRRPRRGHLAPACTPNEVLPVEHRQPERDDDPRSSRAKVLELTGARRSIVHQPLPTDDPKVRQPDIDEGAPRSCGWEPRVGLDEGLRRTLAYFQGRVDRSASRAASGAPAQERPCAESSARSGAMVPWSKASLDGLRVLEYRGYDSRRRRRSIDGHGRVDRAASARAARPSRVSALAGRRAQRARAGHRPHALGDARPALDDERAPARRIARAHRASCTTASFENYLELRAELEARGVRCSRDRHRGARAPRRARVRALGGRPAARPCARALARRAATTRSRCLAQGARRARCSSARARDRRSRVAVRRGRRLPRLRRARRCSRTARDRVPRGRRRRRARAGQARRDGSRRTAARPRAARHIDWNPEDAGLGGVAALHAQGDPRAAGRARAHRASSRIRRRAGDVTSRAASSATTFLQHRSQRVQIVACGTALHAGIIGALPDRGSRRDSGRRRLRLRVPLPRSARSCPARWRSPSPSRARRPTRSGRRGWRASSAPAWSRSATSPAARRCASADRVILTQRRPRDRRREHQGLHGPGRGGLPARDPHGPRARLPRRADGARARSPSCGSCGPRWKRCSASARWRACAARRRATYGQRGLPVPRPRSELSRRARGRAQAEGDLATCTPRATPPAR